MPITKAEALANTQELLAMAKIGLADIESGDPRKRRPGLMNVVTFGRAVTQALQRLRGIESTFDAWYRPRIGKLGGTDLFKFFNTLRNAILKEGELQLSNVTHIEHLDGAEITRLMANPPPGARSLFIGDQLGGNGWVVDMPDGSTKHLYVELPSDIAVKSWLELPNAPTEHAGTPIPDASIETLSRLYVDELSRLVDEAVKRFAA